MLRGRSAEREALAGGHIVARAKPSDREVMLKPYTPRFGIDQFVARMQPVNASNEYLPARGFQRLPQRAFERHRRFCDPWRRDPRGCYRRQSDLLQLADIGRQTFPASMHFFGHRLVAEMHDELAAAGNIHGGVLERAIVETV